MSNDTIIDFEVVERAADQTGVELVPDYGEQQCFAVKGAIKDVIDFHIQVALEDPDLAVNLNDAMRFVVGMAWGDLVVWWFPGYRLESPPGSLTRTTDGEIDYGDEDPDRAESDHILEDELQHPEADDPFRGSDV